MRPTMRSAMLAPSALLLASCAATWTRPGGTADMRAMDQKECEFEGAKASSNNPDPLTRSSDRENVEQACLRAKGWERQ
jgi:hypothetical protein